MPKTLFTMFVVALLLVSCAPSGRISGAQQSSEPATVPATAQNSLSVDISSDPTITVSPSPSSTATASATATSDYSQVGLPAETTGTVVQDFVTELCQADWFTRNQKISCPGNGTQADSGYVQVLDGTTQGYASSIGVLLSYPPQKTVETISSKYPAITVKKGDRFRAVLDCRAHSACDVEFILDFYTSQGHAGLTHWRHLFADGRIVVDYSLDALAGQTVQFDLAVYSKGNRTDGYAVWIAPHIYRPAQ